MSTCLHLGEEEPHETCMLAVYNLTSQGVSVWKRNGLYMCYPSVLVHLFSSALYVRDLVSVSAAAEYTPAFLCLTDRCDPRLFPLVSYSRAICSEFGASQHFDISKKKKKKKDTKRTLKCSRQSNIVSEWNIVPRFCLCVPKAIITLQVHHIPAA